MYGDRNDVCQCPLHCIMPYNHKCVECVILFFTFVLSSVAHTSTMLIERRSCSAVWHILVQHHHLAQKKYKYFVVELWWNYSSTLSYFSFQPVLHDWCNKGCGMCYPVCGMVHIKNTLLLIEKSSPCGDSEFPLSLSEWSFTNCLTPYNCKIKCVECIIK